MRLKYTTLDLKRYILLVDNYDNLNFTIPTKDLSDFRISYAILNDCVLTEIEAEKALSTLQRIESSKTCIISNTKRTEANIFISRPIIRMQVFLKHGCNCLKCGSNYKMSLDHVIPVSKGGLNSLDNLQPLCKNCNSKKGSKIIDYR